MSIIKKVVKKKRLTKLKRKTMVNDEGLKPKRVTKRASKRATKAGGKRARSTN